MHIFPIFANFVTSKTIYYNMIFHCRGLTCKCMDLHLTMPCNLVAMILSNFLLFIESRRILTSNIQVYASTINRKCTNKHEINAENLKPWKKYYMLATSFRCATGCNEIKWVYIPVWWCQFMSGVQLQYQGQKWQSEPCSFVWKD